MFRGLTSKYYSKYKNILMKKVLTLCLLVENSKILLGMKKRGWGEG